MAGMAELGVETEQAGIFDEIGWSNIVLSFIVLTVAVASYRTVRRMIDDNQQAAIRKRINRFWDKNSDNRRQ